MPYLGLKGNGLLAGIALSSGMGFVLFGKYYLLTSILQVYSSDKKSVALSSLLTSTIDIHATTTESLVVFSRLPLSRALSVSAAAWKEL